MLTPNTSPICRLIVTTPEPVDARAGGRSAVAAETIVGSAKPTPMPPTIQPGRISVTYDGCAPTLLARTTALAPNSAQPIAASAPAETRCATRCDTAAKTGTISGPGATASPVLIGDQPQTCCSQRTIASSPAANESENSTPVTLAHANARTRSSAGSTIGSGCRLLRTQKPAMHATAN